MQTKHLTLAKRVADLFAKLPQAEAVALSGSMGGGPTDVSSDIDLYVYTRAEIPLEVRRKIVERSGGASMANLGLNFWGPGDEWFDAATGIEVDIIYFDVQWMEDQINRVVRDHQASLGYSTCFWYTVRHSQVFHDPNGWFAGLQSLCRQEYPEPLRQRIVAHNHPVLRSVIPSYANQLEKAVKRGDLISINHRLAALFASYFDIIFAVNWKLHPGGKRLLEKAAAGCEKLPANMEADITALLEASASSDERLLGHVSKLLDHLDELVEMEGFGHHFQ